MSSLNDLCGPRAREAADGLMAVLQPLVRSPGGRQRVPGVVIELLQALMQQADVSELGSASGRTGRLVDVTGYGSPADAGAAVGLSARRVRQLCAVGVVAHERVGARGYLVDVNDLRRHIRGEVA